MCKIFAMSNMSKVKITRKFIHVVRNEVCRSGDKHGFGYALLDESGSIGGERTMRPAQWNALLPNPAHSRTGSLPIVQRTRDYFGEVNFNKPKSFIGHGRFSTNDVALENTHPFYNGELAMIHNGVVYDPDSFIPEKELETTNDTEILLRCWEKGGMPTIEKNVTGYYAMAILDNKGLLHIVRDDTATLYIAYSKTVDSFIFATTPEIIKSVARRMQWSIEMPEELIENIHVIFDGNEILKQTDINPRASKPMTEKERAAFGNGDDRAWDYRSNDSKYGSNVIDATARTTSKKPDAVAPEDEVEPSYRENAKRSKGPQAYATAVEEGELDREIIADGAPNVTFGFNEDADGLPTNGIDEIEDVYSKIS